MFGNSIQPANKRVFTTPPKTWDRLESLKERLLNDVISFNLLFEQNPEPGLDETLNPGSIVFVKRVKGIAIAVLGSSYKRLG